MVSLSDLTTQYNKLRTVGSLDVIASKDHNDDRDLFNLIIEYLTGLGGGGGGGGIPGVDQFSLLPDTTLSDPHMALSLGSIKLGHFLARTPNLNIEYLVNDVWDFEFGVVDGGGGNNMEIDVNFHTSDHPQNEIQDTDPNSLADYLGGYSTFNNGPQTFPNETNNAYTNSYQSFTLHADADIYKVIWLKQQTGSGNSTEIRNFRYGSLRLISDIGT